MSLIMAATASCSILVTIFSYLVTYSVYYLLLDPDLAFRIANLRVWV